MALKVLFLMGPGHCGSTLLDLLLGSHSRGFSLGEIYRLGKVLADQPGPRPRICGVCPEFCGFWNGRAPLTKLSLLYRRDTLPRRAVSAFVRTIWNPYQLIATWSERDVLVDSSKHPQWIRSQLAHGPWRGVEPTLIYLLRDGRAVVSSYFRKYPERGLEPITENWRRKVEAMSAFYDQFDKGPKLQVRYEELATNPAATLRDLCSQVGIEFESGMLSFWEHDHHHVMGNGGTRSMIFRHRLEQSQQHDVELTRRMQEAKQHYSHDYYDRSNIGIQLDERWKQELSGEQLAAFQRIAGPTNAALSYDEKAA